MLRGCCKVSNRCSCAWGFMKTDKEKLIKYKYLTLIGIVLVVVGVLLGKVVVSWVSVIISAMLQFSGWIMIASGVIPWCNMNKK